MYRLGLQSNIPAAYGYVHTSQLLSMLAHDDDDDSDDDDDGGDDGDDGDGNNDEGGEEGNRGGVGGGSSGSTRVGGGRRRRRRRGSGSFGGGSSGGSGYGYGGALLLRDHNDMMMGEGGATMMMGGARQGAPLDLDALSRRIRTGEIDTYTYTRDSGSGSGSSNRGEVKGRGGRGGGEEGGGVYLSSVERVRRRGREVLEAFNLDTLDETDSFFRLALSDSFTAVDPNYGKLLESKDDFRARIKELRSQIDGKMVCDQRSMRVKREDGGGRGRGGGSTPGAAAIYKCRVRIDC